MLVSIHLFMLLVRNGWTFGTVARCIGVKYPYIKLGILANIPKTSGVHIKPCPIISIGWGQSKGFSIQRLQKWFDSRIGANFSEYGNRWVPYLIVANRGDVLRKRNGNFFGPLLYYVWVCQFSTFVISELNCLCAIPAQNNVLNSNLS